MDETSSPYWQASPLILAALALSVGCAHLGPAPDRIGRGRVLVVEPLWVPNAPANADAVTQAIIERWTELDVLEPVPFTQPLGAECADTVRCLQDIGREAGADKVVVYRLGNLGPTTVIRVQALDVSSASMEQTLQQVLEGEKRAAENAVLTLTDELAELYAPPEAWYARPWVWVAGAAAILGGTLAVVVLTDEDDDAPNIVVTPP